MGSKHVKILLVLFLVLFFATLAIAPPAPEPQNAAPTNPNAAAPQNPSVPTTDPNAAVVPTSDPNAQAPPIPAVPPTFSPVPSGFLPPQLNPNVGPDPNAPPAQIPASPLVEPSPTIPANVTPPATVPSPYLPSPDTKGVPMWNPWKPNRSVAVTSPASPSPQSSFKDYHFVIRDFLIAIGVVFGVIGVLVMGLIVWKKCRGGRSQQEEFDKEQDALAKRTNSVRTARGVAAALGGQARGQQGAVASDALLGNEERGRGQGRSWQIES
ncbi:hypothetical protein HDV00_001803 [Rhizophlyctis rosea]|nr:hypothetical protein HDV00_001803 [Rhizophlyctis rosea]